MPAAGQTMLQRACLSAIVFWLGTAGAGAAQRAYAPAMTCAAVQALIAARGAVSIATGPQLYDQYIRDQSACLPSQTTQPDFIATADKPHCLVYRCKWRWSNHSH
jgi:hypothetical protein